MNLKLYKEIANNLPKTNIFLEIESKKGKKPYMLVFFFDENLNLKKENYFTLKEYKKGYERDYVFIASSLRESSSKDTSKQKISLFNFSFEDKKKEKIINNFIRNLENLFNKKLNEEDKEKIKNTILENFEKCEESEYTIKAITFEIKGKKPYELKEVKKEIEKIFKEKILKINRLKTPLKCDVCGKETTEIAESLNNILPFYNAKRRDLSDIRSPLIICKDCAIKLFEIKDAFICYKKISPIFFKKEKIYFTFLFNEANENGKNFVYKFLKSLYESEKNITKLSEIVNKIESIKGKTLFDEKKINFDLLIYSDDGNTKSIKKFIPDIYLNEFVNLIKSFSFEKNGEKQNLLDYVTFLNTVKWRNNLRVSEEKVLFNVYVNLLYSLLKKRINFNKSLRNNLLQFLIKRFKMLPEYGISQRIFIKFDNDFYKMEDKKVLEFAYYIGKMGKIFAFEKINSKKENESSEEKKNNYIKARKIFARILLTRNYRKVKDLIGVYDYLYNKLSHKEAFIPNVNNIFDELTEKREEKIDDKIVKFKMIQAFEERKENSEENEIKTGNSE